MQSLVLHFILKHLGSPNHYARILFLDFSSAFDTMVPQKLFEKLLHLSVPLSLCYWILNFPTDRPQFINFTDDTRVEGLIENSDASSSCQEVDRLVSWRRNNNLEDSETREMIIDFRKEKSPVVPLLIDRSPIEIVDSFKFLGTIISSGLDWEANIDSTLKKTQQRLHFLRQLKKFGLWREILVQFYRAVVESVLCFSLASLVWQYQKSTTGDNSIESSGMPTTL